MKISSMALLRMLDANFNRAKEGFRVCEDVVRFYMNDACLTQQYKKARHALNDVLQTLKIDFLLKARNISADVGRKTISIESRREDLKSVFFANSQRIKESLRVLEECSKLVDIKTAQRLKKLRYLAYDLEKKAINRL